jgi:hypothetical protein
MYQLLGTRKEQRQANAKELRKQAAGRTPEEQIARLDLKFGPGLGAKKERAKLAARIEARRQGLITAIAATVATSSKKAKKAKKGKKSNASVAAPQG